MNNNPRKRATKDEESAQTTADATPALAGIIQSMSPGASLEKQLSQAFSRLGQPFDAAGVSLSWSGLERLVKRMTDLGCYLEMQTRAGHCLCRVLRVLKGNAVAKQLSSMESSALPETVAKAALLALMEMEPPSS